MKSYRFFELGCGNGANLLSLAFYNPESTFIGIDSADSELDRAREGVKHLGLNNIEFLSKDVRDIAAEDFEPSDYVIAHGLYSWVPENARDAILRFCRESLTPSGLAYISYNAQPGWSTRRLVREIFLRARTVRGAAVQDKAKKAIEVAAHLLEDMPSRNDAFSALLAGELEHARKAKPGYVHHEYLAEENKGFWFRDFIECARRRGLDYVADAQFCRWEGHVPSEVKMALAKRDLDLIEREEAADLLCNRYFRASILCRADAPRAPISHRAILEEVQIATSLGAESNPFNLQNGAVEWFVGTNGSKITIGASITKAAVVLLAAQWPRGMRLKTLYDRASETLASNSLEVTPNALSQLAEDLIVLFEAGQIDLRLKGPEHSAQIPDYPRAHALARYEAEHRDTLTTPYHLPIPFDPRALALVRGLDGSRSLKDLGKAYGNELANQTIKILARWGLLEQGRAYRR